MKKRTCKALGLTLALALCLSLLPASALAAGGNVAINEKNFPDPNFRAYVETLSGAEDKVFTPAELNKITQIICPNEDTPDSGKIASLAGIEHFNNLRELACFGNKLTKLDLSKNLMLEVLDCGRNRLTQIDVTSHRRLAELYCYENQLTKLDVRHNTELEALSVLDNRLTQIDVSCNPGLQWLECAQNPLTGLDITHNPLLAELDCYENRLTRLDVSQNPELECLFCNDNRLRTLDVSHNPKLSQLYCDGNMLTELNVSGLSKLTELRCGRNRLTRLDLSHNSKLEDLRAAWNQLSGIDLSHNPGIKVLYLYDNYRTLVDGTPLSQLPGFDLSKVSNVKGGSFEGGKVRFDFRAEKMTYRYDCGNGTISDFALIRRNEPPFRDVTKNDYFYNPVIWALENDVTAGIGKGLFGPDQKCTRAQIVTFLWNACGKPEPRATTSSFSDVSEDDWFFTPVIWAVENGITAGIGNNKFGPELVCTRAQAMTFLWKFVGKPTAKITVSFADVSKDDWFYGPVNWAVANKITAGVGNNRFGVDDDCLRAQIVTFMHRALK